MAGPQDVSGPLARRATGAGRPRPTREPRGPDEAPAFRAGREKAAERWATPPGAHARLRSCFFLERAGETPLVFAGDTLFRPVELGGRTVLWGGSRKPIYALDRSRLFTLTGATSVGPQFTVSETR